jgi:hypothetical protein
LGWYAAQIYWYRKVALIRATAETIMPRVSNSHNVEKYCTKNKWLWQLKCRVVSHQE